MPGRKWLKRLGWFVCYWVIGVAAMFALGYVIRLVLS
ncbi:DUF2474 domain-containing protein [Martelella lutilitoris]|uniref:DUF2474 domain-containing protein n=1 Tax=Martelella lutilitoris TaxID=2583532 RepID=A0A7T7HMY0_9HYPH|nr:DUF2474 domain-containing protein [Martelella lutilitoris]QQM32183.1 DUF2474 domain-containing protein [Martelella lutilitoris]